MATADRTEGSAGVARVAVTLPALAALTVGALYAVGSLVRAAQIREAGVAARDGLPLVPLEEILATGIAVIFADLLLVLLWVVSFGWIAWIAREAQRRTSTSIRGLRARNTELAAGQASLEVRTEELLKDLEEVREAAEEHLEEHAPDDAAPEELRGRLTELRTTAEGMAKESESLVQQSKALNDELERLEPKPMTARRWAARIALLLALVLASTAPVAIAIVLAFIAWNVLRIRMYPHLAAIVVLLIVTSVLLAEYIAPRPLPHVAVTAQSGNVTEGQLISARGGEWNVALSGGRIATIVGPRSAQTEPDADEPRPPLIIALWDLLR